MQLRKIVVALLALLLAGAVMVPCVRAAADDANTGNQDHIIIPISISNNAQEKSDLNRTTEQKIRLLTPVPSSNLKNVKVPKQIESTEKQNGEFTDQDWAFLRKSMTDLTEKEQDQLITEMKKIQNHTSSLSQDEQTKVIAKIGNYIVIATEGGNSLKMPGQPGHYQLSMAVSQNLGTLTSSHATTLGDYAFWPDDHYDQPPLGQILNRHSWVLDGTSVPFFDNYGPDSGLYYITGARTDFNNYLSDDAYIDIGKSIHFTEDMGCPYHTTGGALPQHMAYENWIMTNWTTLGLDSAIQVSEYYPVTDPVAQAKELADFSHQFLSFFTYEINNDPNWQTNADMIYYTQVLFTETEKMTIGMVQYANKFDSPDTAGSNSVAINDIQTSYAYINSIGDSAADTVSFTITHPDASQLEIWVSSRQDSSYPYTDYKVWDRQPIGGSPFTFTIQATGFVNYHDWRLIVKDNVAGSTGTIDEFSININ